MMSVKSHDLLVTFYFPNGLGDEHNIRTFSNFQFRMFNAHTVIDWIVFSHFSFIW